MNPEVVIECHRRALHGFMRWAFFEGPEPWNVTRRLALARRLYKMKIGPPWWAAPGRAAENRRIAGFYAKSLVCQDRILWRAHVRDAMTGAVVAMRRRGADAKPPAGPRENPEGWPARELLAFVYPPGSKPLDHVAAARLTAAFAVAVAPEFCLFLSEAAMAAVLGERRATLSRRVVRMSAMWNVKFTVQKGALHSNTKEERLAMIL